MGADPGPKRSGLSRRGPPTAPEDAPCPHHCNLECPSSFAEEQHRRTSRRGSRQRRTLAEEAAATAADKKRRVRTRPHATSRRPPSSPRSAALRRRPRPRSRHPHDQAPAPAPPPDRPRSPGPDPDGVLLSRPRPWRTLSSGRPALASGPAPANVGPRGSASRPLLAYRAPPRPNSSSPTSGSPAPRRRPRPQLLLLSVGLRVAPGLRFLIFRQIQKLPQGL